LSWPKTPIRSKIRPQASIAVLAEKYHPLMGLSVNPDYPESLSILSDGFWNGYGFSARTAISNQEYFLTVTPLLGDSFRTDVDFRPAQAN